MKGRRLLAWLLALAMIFGLTPTQTMASEMTSDTAVVIEEENPDVVLAEDAGASEEGEIPEAIAEAETEAETEDVSEDVEEPGEKEETASGGQVIEDSYSKVYFEGLYTSDGLLAVEDWEGVEIGTEETAGGILLTGDKEALSARKIVIAKQFNFDGNPAAMVMVDALASKRMNAFVEIYLDDQEEPIASLQLNRQKKDNNWTYAGDRTAVVLEQNITGLHQVSIRIVPVKDDKMTVDLRAIEFMESSVPVIYFDIDESEGTIAAMNADSEHDTECYGSMTVGIPEGYTSEYTDKELKTTTYEMEYIRGRGNSTWMQDKKPYKIKLEKKADLFGMGKNKHWVLLANRLDNSNLRNKITYWIGDQLGMDYTPQSIAVDVVMNGEYLGNYYLSEQIRVGDSRVEIDDLEDSKDATELPLISGGYLLSMSPWTPDKTLIYTSHGNEYQIESPAFDGYQNQAQVDYIQNYMQATEDAIYGDNFCSEDGTSYRELMDAASAIDYWWIQEFSMNGDAFGSGSTYLYKPREDKLYWGPLWDFDYVAWSSYDYSEDSFVAGWQWKEATWFERLFQDETFAREVAERWPTISGVLRSMCAEGGMLDQYADQIRISMKYDMEKWGSYQFDWSEQQGDLTFDEEVDRLRTWILRRTDWVDANVDSLIPTTYKVTFVDRGKTLKTIKTASNSPMIGFPVLGERKGYVLEGWRYIGEDYECMVEEGEYYWFDSDIVLEAVWVKESKAVPVEKIFLKNQVASVPTWCGEYSMPYEIYPYNASVRTLEWSSSDETIAKVDSFGSVYFEEGATGSVTITAKAASGVKASYRLNIFSDEDEEYYWYYDFHLNKTSITMEEGGGAQLYPIFDPDYYRWEITQMTWISLDQDILYVDDNGVIDAIAPGKTSVLLVNLDNNTYKRCDVTVTEASKVGDTFTKSGLKYKITGNAPGKRTVTCMGRSDKKKTSISIPKTVTRHEITYKVTAVADQAFKGSNIKSLKLGSNITRIGKNAFADCKSLKTIQITGSKLAKIGDGAWKNIYKNAVFTVPSSKLKAYKKLLTAKTGYKKTMKVKAGK